MITNLEENRIVNSVDKAIIDSEKSISVVEAKFSDAIQRVENMKLNLTSSLEGVNYEDITTTAVNNIKSVEDANEIISDEFISTAINTDDIMDLAVKYSDNRLRLINKLTNSYMDTNVSGDSSSFYDDSSTNIDGTQYDSSKAVINDSLLTLLGANKIVNGKPNMATMIKSEPGHNRSLFINIYNGMNLVTSDDLKSRLPFSIHSNLVRPDDNSQNSTPFIVLDRSNKINSFDFGIQYITKEETVKLCVVDGLNTSIIDTGFNTTSGAFIKRFFGSFIIKDNGTSIETSYILNNSEESLFDGDLPEFKFSFAYDSKFIYMYLEDVKPYRLTFTNVEDLNGSKKFAATFIRDIFELMYSNNPSTSNEDDIIAIKNEYGINVTPEGIRDLSTHLNILNGNPADLYKNVYVIPNFMVNLSLKDNSFFVLDSFIVGSLYGHTDILTLPKSIMHIIPNGKTQVQLEGIPLTNGNDIKLLSNPIANKFVTTNVGFNNLTEKFVKSKTISEIVEENNNFISDHVIDGHPVFYHSKIYITTTIDDVSKNVDTNSVPDYVINEIGRFEVVGDEIFVNCKSITYYRDMNTIEKDIQSAKDLVDIMVSPSIPFKIFSNIDDSGNVITDSFENTIPVEFSNIGLIALKNTLPILSDTSGINVNENSFKGLIKVETVILPDEYEFDGIVVKHLTSVDPIGTLGYVEAKYENEEPLENQAVMSGQEIVYYPVRFLNFTNFTAYPSDFNAIEGSNVEFTIYPKQGFMVSGPAVVNGVETPIVANKFSVLNIISSINIGITIIPAPVEQYFVYIDSFNDCSINPGSTIKVDKGATLEYEIINITSGFFINSITVNGVAVIPDQNGKFVIVNIQSDKHIVVVCSVIPPKLFDFEIVDPGNCVTDPVPGIYTVIEGNPFQIMVTPNDKYEINKFFLDGVEQAHTSNIFRIDYVSSDHIFTAEVGLIPPKEFYATIIESTFCSINPSGSHMILEGTSEEYTITPNSGYQIYKAYVNEVEVSVVGGKFTIGPMVENCTVRAICEIIPPQIFKIDCIGGSNFTLSSNGPTDATENLNFQVTATPATGYYVSKYIIDGVEVASGLSNRITTPTTYTFVSVQSDHTFSVVVAKIKVDVNVIQSDNCTVTPTVSTVDYNTSATFNIIPNPGYKILSIKVDGVDVTITSSLVVTNVIVNKTVAVVCDIIYHTITLISDANSTITGPTTVAEFSDTLYTFTPETGYHITDVKIDDVSIGVVGNYLLTDVISNRTITITSAINGYTVATSVIGNGSISPVNPTINYGGNQTFNITPTAGNRITSVTVDGVDLGAVTSCTINNIISGSHTVAVVFDIIYHTITLIPGLHCDIVGLTQVPEGSTSSYSFIIDPGYHITNAIVDGVSIGVVDNYILTDVISNHTITLTVAINTYTVATSVVGNGSISPVNPTVNYGGNQTFNITPGAGYHITSVTVDGVDLGAVTSCTINNIIDSNHTVEVVFDITYHTITLTPGSNLTITGTTNVAEGSNQSYSIKPASGYYITSITVDDIPVTIAPSITLSNIVADHTIAAVSEVIPPSFYSIDITADAKCAVTSSTGSTSIARETDVTFTITPNVGYNVTDVKIDGVSQGIITILYFSNVTADHTIEVIGAVVQYNLTVTQVANCTITPSTVVINHGDNQAFTLTPATGYHVVSLIVDGVSQGAIASYTFTNVTDNHTITATVALNTYAITTIITAGVGTLTPSSPAVNHGSNQTFTITPGTGYDISDVLVDGVSQGVITSYTFTNVTTTHTISVVFTIKTFAITVTQVSNCTISPSSLSADYGSNKTFTITPATGYHITDVKLDGVSQGTGSSLTITNITAIHTITATVALNTYAITSVVTAGTGTLTPVNPSVNHGSNQTFTITPGTGYDISDVLVDGISQGAIGTYTFTNVTAVHTISVTFVLKTFTITVTQTANGTISPSTSSANYGSNKTFTITPATGYQIASVTVDGVSQGTGNSYIFTNVTAVHTITATYTKIQLTISSSATNGTVTPSSVTIDYGTNTTINFTPNAHYEINDVTLDGVSQGAVTSLTLTNVTANHTIVLTCTIITRTITATNGTNVTVAPLGANSVNDGSNLSFTITPASGYYITKLTVDGVDVAAASSYTFTNVTANHTITASALIIPPVMYDITTSNGTYHTVTPYGVTQVEKGTDSPLISITPTSGYYISKILVDGTAVRTISTAPDVGVVETYTFINVQASHVVTVETTVIPPKYFLVTVTATGNYQSTPVSTSILKGTDATFNWTPQAGYRIKTLTIDGTPISTSTLSWTFYNVQTTHTIIVETEVIPPTLYNMVVTQVANCTITPAGTTQLEINHSLLITANPATNYRVVSFIINGTTYATDGGTGPKTYSLINSLAQDYTITAVVTLITYVVTLNTPDHFTITGNTSPKTLNINSGATFTVTPDALYRYLSITVNGTSMVLDGNPNTIGGSQITLGGNDIIINNINADLNIVVTMELIPIVYRAFTVIVYANTTYNLTYGGNTYNGISATTTYQIPDGTSVTVTGIPATGYRVDTSYTGTVASPRTTSLGAVASKTFNITSDQSFLTDIIVITYNITMTQPANAVISPGTPTIPVPYNTNQVYTITPNSGYQIDSVTIDGVAVTSGANLSKNGTTGVWTYTFVGVLATHTITAVTSLKPVIYRTVTLTGGTGYTYTYNGTTYASGTSFQVVDGTDVQFTVNILGGYVYDKLVVNGVNLYPISPYTIQTINVNTTVSVITVAAPSAMIWSPSVTYHNTQGIILKKEGSDWVAYKCLAATISAGTDPSSNYNTDGSASQPFQRIGVLIVPSATDIANGVPSNPPEWGPNTIYAVAGLYSMYEPTPGVHKVYVSAWWTQNNCPEGGGTTNGAWVSKGTVNDVNITWNSAITYVAGDTVMYNGAMYVAQYFVAANTTPSTNSGYSGAPWKFAGFASTDIAWVTPKTYSVGNTVYYAGYIYTSNTLHTSSAGNRPDVDSAVDTSKTWTIEGRYGA